jgi:hypothetical protein
VVAVADHSSVDAAADHSSVDAAADHDLSSPRSGPSDHQRKMRSSRPPVPRHQLESTTLAVTAADLQLSGLGSGPPPRQLSSKLSSTLRAQHYHQLTTSPATQQQTTGPAVQAADDHWCCPVRVHHLSSIEQQLSFPSGLKKGSSIHMSLHRIIGLKVPGKDHIDERLLLSLLSV